MTNVSPNEKKCPECGLVLAAPFTTNRPDVSAQVRAKLREWGYCGGHDDDE